MKKKFYLIYKITNNVNQKFYIGKHETNNLDDDYFGSGKHLNSAKEKYGLENFTKTILFYCQSREEMNLLEHCVVTPEFCKREDVYNINEGGDGGWYAINSTGKNMSGKWKPASTYRKEKVDKLGYNPYQAAVLNKKAYYSEELDQVRYFLSTDIIPEGFELGNPKAYGSGTSETHWYHNVKTNEACCLTDIEYQNADHSVWKLGMSPTRKQFVRFNPTKGKHWYHNDKGERKLFDPSTVPDGWFRK